MEQRIVVSGRELIRIGKLTSTVGIKGSVKITPLFFNSKEVQDLIVNYAKKIYIYSEGSFPKKITVISSRLAKNTLVVVLKEITTIDDSKKSLGKALFIEQEAYEEYLKQTDSIVRYIGYLVEDIVLGRLGVVTDVQRHGQKLLIVDDGTSDGKMIPFVPQFIDNIDDKNKCVKTNLPEGIFG